MHIDVKICGLKTEEAVRAAIAGGASHAGFIFFEKSPRHTDPETAGKLAALAGAAGLRSVAVTVDADDATLDRIVSVMKPDMLQLHGKESPTRVADIRAKFGLPVMKALSIREAADLEKLASYEGIADRFLLDAKAPEGSDLPGGNGVSFDWRLLQSLDTQTPWMLSGGLDAANIAEALAVSRATSIDISSGVESAPGRKDIAKIAAFIKTVRDMPSGNENHKAAAAGQSRSIVP